MEDFVNDTQQDTQYNEASQEATEQKDMPSEQEQQKKGPTLEENIARMRERYEQLQRENETMRNHIEQQQKQQQSKKEEEWDISDDDLIEGKHLRKIAQKSKSEMEQIKKEIEAQRILLAEARLKTTMPDYDDVVNDKNVKILIERYPRYAEIIKNINHDTYEQGSTAYNLIKDLGISRAKEFEGDHAKAQENLGKPRPVSTIAQQGSSPLSKANAFAGGLTEDLKKQLWQETLRDMKRSRD